VFGEETSIFENTRIDVATKERFRRCEVPETHAVCPRCGLADAMSLFHKFPNRITAPLLRKDGAKSGNDAAACEADVRGKAGTVLVAGNV
jgi:hypothetical protein